MAPVAHTSPLPLTPAGAEVLVSGTAVKRWVPVMVRPGLANDHWVPLYRRHAIRRITSLGRGGTAAEHRQRSPCE